MSEHAWVLENIATYHAGGLETGERELLQEHVAACEPCALALEKARGIDRTLEALFADVRPDPALEDRMVRALRAGPVRSIWHTPVSRRALLGAAAVLLLGVLGAGLSNLVLDGGLPFPGMPLMSTQLAAQNNLRQLGEAVHNDQPSFTAQLARTPQFANAPVPELPDANQAVVDARRASGLKDSEQTLARRAGPAPVVAFGTPTVQKGTRAVPLNVNAASTAGGFVQPHAHVDILSTEASPNGESSTKVILQNVPVLAVDQSAQRPDDRQAAVSNNVTVEVTPEQAERLSLAQKMGTISMNPSGPRPKGNNFFTEDPARNVYTYRNELPSAAAAQTPAAGWFRPGQLVAGGPKGEGSERGEDKTTVRLVPINGVDPVKSEGAQKAADPKAQDNKSEGKSDDGRKTRPDDDSGQAKPGGEKKAEPSPAPITTRKIIRSGEIEFEIESFDSAVATITKLVTGIKGGFIATVNSEKLPNGKVRGSVVVRVPPDALDTLVLDLRRELGKGGELKGQRIGSQDITKQYTDLESRLRAARAMEERLLQVIKTGKGEIKDLVQAEKELGVWRTKIEEIEGELRYYGNLVALSTLTITLYEREIRAPFAVVETERIQMGIEVEDVDKTLREALAAVAEAKGRVTKSELKQHAAGQFSALLHFEVAPEAAGPMRDRLKQLGTVARLEIDRLQQTEGGTGRPQDAKSKRSDSQFIVALYNLTNVAPRETVHLKLVCEDVEAVYKAILARLDKVAARVVTSNLNRQRSEQTTGTLNFEVRAAEAEAVLQSLKEAGEVMRLQITENPDVQNATKSKRGFNVELWALGQVAPRETSVLHLATRDVPSGYRALQDAVTKAKGRILNAQLNEQDNQNITAQLDFELRRVDEAAVDAALSKIGDVFSRNVVRAQDNENVIDSKVRLQVSLIKAANLRPRENFTFAFEVADVETAKAAIDAMVSKSGGRTLPAQLTHKRDGSVVAKLVLDVPLASSSALVEELKMIGKLRLHDYSQNLQVPELALAVARFDVTLSNTELIVPSDDGLWPQVRKGLSNSLLVIFLSLSWIIFGILVVLPWALLVYGVYRLVLWLRKKAGSATTTA